MRGIQLVNRNHVSNCGTKTYGFGRKLAETALGGVRTLTTDYDLGVKVAYDA
jgi:hypothetical protein